LPFKRIEISDESYNIVSSTAERIKETFVEKTQPNGFDIISLEDALEIDDFFLDLAYKPNKQTILHRFIKNYYCQEWNYLRRKTDGEFPNYIYPILDELNLKYSKNSTTLSVDYNYYLLKIICNNCDKFIDEAFHILFDDRNLMQKFSLIVSRSILNLKQDDFPEYMLNDGRIKRYSHWNKWLVDALLHREKGRCAECGCDLTHVFAIENKVNIDHIVPISKGGTNDPTNLQILCSICNGKKSNTNSEAGNLKHRFW
jgi:hypothetical protein